MSENTNYYGDTTEQEKKALIQACANLDESEKNETQATSGENGGSNLLYFKDENGKPLPHKKHLAVEKTIQELTGPNSSLTPEQLTMVKYIPFRGKPIITDEQQENISFRQNDSLSDENNETSDNVFSDLKFAARRAEIAEPGTPHHAEMVEKANSYIPQIYHEGSQEAQNLNLQVIIAPGSSEINNLHEKIEALYGNPPSPSSQAVAPYTELQTYLDELNNAKTELGLVAPSNAANSVI